MGNMAEVKWMKIYQPNEDGIIEELKDIPLYFDGVEPYQPIILSGRKTYWMLNNDEIEPKEGYKKSEMLVTFGGPFVQRSLQELTDAAQDDLDKYAKALGFESAEATYRTSHGFNRFFYLVNFK